MKKPISESRFQMWRAIIATAHADAHMQPAEKTLIENYLNEVSFTEEQKKQLHQEMNQPLALDSILPLITEPQDRAMCVHFARLLLWSDGFLFEDEKSVLDKLQSHALKEQDLKKIQGLLKNMKNQFQQSQPKGLRGALVRWWESFNS